MAELCYHRAHYAAAQIAKLPGYQLLIAGHSKGVCCRLPTPSWRDQRRAARARHRRRATIYRAITRNLGQAMLLCVTEMNSRTRLRVVDALKG